MTFTHHVVKVTLQGETELAKFYVQLPFGENALREFKRIARTYGGKVKPVSDSTLASVHYTSTDGTVYELR